MISHSANLVPLSGFPFAAHAMLQALHWGITILGHSRVPDISSSFVTLLLRPKF